MGEKVTTFLMGAGSYFENKDEKKTSPLFL